MSDSILREFLVKLGFKVDQPALKSFSEGISKATKAVFGLAAAVEGTAVVVAAGIARFSANLEDLYFAARRTGSSATALMAFQRTAQNFGASAEEARGSVEGLAHALRMNPGNASLLQSLGVHLHRSKNGAYDATDALMQFGGAMRSRGYFKPDQFYMAEQYGQMFGISEKTLLALQNGDFAREFSRIQTEMRGNGFNKAAQDAHNFMMSLRDLETQLQVFGAQVVDALQKKLGISLRQLDDWVQKNGPRLAAVLVYDVSKIIDAAEWLAGKISELISWFDRVNTATDGWAGKLAGLLVIMRATGATSIVTGVMSLAAAFMRLGAGIAAAQTAAGAGALATLLGRLGIVGAAVGAYELAKLYKRQEAERKGVKSARMTTEARSVLGWLDSVIPRSSQARTMLGTFGWSDSQIAGILGNLQREDPGLDPTKVGDHGAAYGIAQWHKRFWAMFQTWSGGVPIQASTLMQQLAFLNWDLTKGPDRVIGNMMRATNDPATVARLMSARYERPAAGAAEANRRAAAAVNIDQHTEVHVHGVKDARAAGHEVAQQQRGVNAALVRHFAPVVQ